MIEGKYLYGSQDDLQDVFNIRRQVFIDEENMSEENEFDGYDEMCVHVILSVRGKKLAAGRILYDGEEYRIGHIAVLKGERGKGYGEFLVRMLIDKAFLNGAEEVYVSAKVSAIKFYEKIGFSKIGESYKDKAGMQRLEMKVSKNTLCKECQKK